MPKAPAWAKAKPSQARLLALGPAHDFPKPKPPKARPKPGLPGQAGAVTSLVVVDDDDDVGDMAKPLSLLSTTWVTRGKPLSLSLSWRWRWSTWVVIDDVAMVIDLGRRRRGDGGGRPGLSSWVIDVAVAVADVDVVVMSSSSSSSSTWP